jgi:putative intracellular protease/amidase
MAKRILLVCTSHDAFDGKDTPTGLWLSELSHAWDVFEEAGFDCTVASIAGGQVPIDPRSTQDDSYDNSAKAWTAEGEKKEMLDNTPAIADIDVSDYDAIYLAGGHGAMYDFPSSVALAAAVNQLWGAGKIVSAVCHGYCGLVDVKKPEGGWFVFGRKLTGFSWKEEKLAGVSDLVPYDVERRAKDHGAVYKHALVPFSDYVVVDGRLATGENPRSAKSVAQRVVELLG